MTWRYVIEETREPGTKHTLLAKPLQKLGPHTLQQGARRSPGTPVKPNNKQAKQGALPQGPCLTDKKKKHPDTGVHLPLS